MKRISLVMIITYPDVFAQKINNSYEIYYNNNRPAYNKLCMQKK